jgi:hypothetical protein
MSNNMQKIGVHSFDWRVAADLDGLAGKIERKVDDTNVVVLQREIKGLTKEAWDTINGIFIATSGTVLGNLISKVIEAFEEWADNRIANKEATQPQWALLFDGSGNLIQSTQRNLDKTSRDTTAEEQTKKHILPPY